MVLLRFILRVVLILTLSFGLHEACVTASSNMDWNDDEEEDFLDSGDTPDLETFLCLVVFLAFLQLTTYSWTWNRI